ncbi:MAG: hypothetical protein ACE5E2_06445 [Candidatus Binatia bacterium]
MNRLIRLEVSSLVTLFGASPKLLLPLSDLIEPALVKKNAEAWPFAIVTPAI